MEGETRRIGVWFLSSTLKKRNERKMKEQPTYVSQERNPFITIIIFNFQQLYQHLFPGKSHMTCSKPTMDKPYGVSLKGRFRLRWGNNRAGWCPAARYSSWMVPGSRWVKTPPCQTGPPIFYFPRGADNRALPQAGISGLDTDPLWSEGIMGCHKYLPPCITCTGKHCESFASCAFLNVHVSLCAPCTFLSVCVCVLLTHGL